ncbi:reverse transcriptase domain-containing protein [Tanacetum coccineum]
MSKKKSSERHSCFDLEDDDMADKFNAGSDTRYFPTMEELFMDQRWFSLKELATELAENEPPIHIHTWKRFLNPKIRVKRFFPPSKTTKLRNEITRFQQRFGETFSEAWDRFKDLLNKCPHHGFSPLYQIDTFYNSLNQSEQDSLNSVANVSSASGSSSQDAAITALTKQVEALVSFMNRPVNSIQNGCETCGGPHAYYECQAAGGYTQENVYATTGTYNQGGNSYQPQDVQHQRRVNPKIHEVIKAKVIKLLDVGLIYPISDSPWVSPVHVVPNKGGMTVITNENNELIPTRLVTG